MAELEYAPARVDLRGQVLGYARFRFGARALRRRLLIPDGVVRLTLGFGGPVRVRDAIDPRRGMSAPSVVGGIRNRALVAEHRGSLHGVLVMLSPLAAYRVLAVPMDKLVSQCVDAVALLGRWAQSLIDRLADCPDWRSRFALLDQVLARRLAAGPPPSPEVAWAWRELRRSDGLVSVDGLAAQTQWSRRHLERQFREQVGLSPKQITQVMRLQRALRLHELGMGWAECAATAGYHDQPHFDRTFKGMVGSTPTRFWALRQASDPGGPIDYLPGRITSALLVP